MPQLEITIRRRGSRPLPTSAWYLPGGDASDWLTEITRWPVDQAKVRVVPIAGESPTAADGVLVIPADGGFAASANCVPFGRIGEGVYLPVDAELAPPPTDSELQNLFPSEGLFVFVPGRGLTEVEPGRVLTLPDLIAPLRVDDANWDFAEPGFAFPSRIAELLPLNPPSAQSILDDGRDDIGQDSDQIANLPKTPNEPLSGAAGAVQRAAIVAAALPLLGMAKALSALKAALPSTSAGGAAGSAGGGSLGALGDLAQKMMQGVSRSLQATRNREVSRLLNMLQDNPDEGLRYAIPFGGDAHRGIGAAGGSLGRRDVNFSLGGLGGGGPADVWELSYEHQQQLTQRYRDLADREMRLGRFRRAAYIFAQLLGDFRSAASALERGKHFREAAVLYSEQLRNPKAAAECLERGELWNEAIEAYRELGHHEKVGDLLAHIDRLEEARQAYHAAAGELRDKHDLVGAARLYVEKLRDADLALSVLDDGWPHTSQAARCVKAGFGIRARLGRHEESAARIDFLFEQASALGRHAEVAELLADACTQYPEAAVQQHAKGRAGAIVVTRIQFSGADEAHRLTRVYARLHPEDALLPRDVQRFHGQVPPAAAPAQPPQRPRPRDNKLTLLSQFELPCDASWRAATIAGDQLIVAGVADGRIVLSQSDLDGRNARTTRPWSGVPIRSDASLLLHGSDHQVHLIAVGEPPLTPVPAIEFKDNGRVVADVGTPRGVGVVWGSAAGTLGQTWTIEDRDDPVLVCVDRDGVVVSSQSLLQSADLPWDEVATPVPMCATSRRLVLGIGASLASVHGGQVDTIEEFPTRITAMAGGGPYAAQQVCVSLESGAALVRVGFAGHVTSFAEGMDHPLTLINRGGFVVAADDSRVAVWQPRGRQDERRWLAPLGDQRYQHGRPAALLALPDTDQFAVVSESGVVSRFEVNT